jgi:hypothetical protein
MDACLRGPAGLGLSLPLLSTVLEMERRSPPDPDVLWARGSLSRSSVSVCLSSRVVSPLASAERGESGLSAVGVCGGVWREGSRLLSMALKICPHQAQHDLHSVMQMLRASYV